MNLTDEQLASLPADAREALTLADKSADDEAPVALSTMDDMLDAVTDQAGVGLTAWLPVLYPGKWNDLQFTAAMIQEMADGFNPAGESCPVKIGHSADDTQPELSQIREVRVAPCTLTNGKIANTCLWVRMNRTPEALASQRQYRKTSIEAWPPQHQSNPTPGKWNLKGLAFLGSAAPAVPNLPPTTLSATDPKGGTIVSITPEEAQTLKDQHETLLASHTASTKESMRLKAENEELTARFATQAKESKAAAIKAEIAEFRDKLTPAQMQMVEAVALALDSDDPTVTLSATQAPCSPRSCLLGFLQGMTKTGNGLTNPFNVPALSGKSGKEADEEDLSDETFRAKKVKEFKEKNPKASTVDAIQYGQQCVKERAKK